MESDKKSVSLKKDRQFSFSSITIIMLAALVFVLLSLTTKTFMSVPNLYSVLYDTSFEAIAVIGFTWLMIMGEIDLSIGGVYCFSGALVGVLMRIVGLPLVAAIVITMIGCVVVGLLMGFIIARFRLNSMMITLGVMSVFQGLSAIAVATITRAYPMEYVALAGFKIFNINFEVILMVVAAIVLELLLHNSSIFKKMYIVGQNIETARVYGIKAERLKMLTFMVSTVCAGFAGILAGSRIGTPQLETGQGLEFIAVTACVLGGASLFGGKGSIVRTFVGLFFLAMLTNGMIIYGIDPIAQQVFIGIILIIAVFIDAKLSSEKF